MTSSAEPPDDLDEVVPGYRVEDSTGAWVSLPWDERSVELPSLGPQVISWAHENLVHHLTGEPWRFTRSQARFLYLWYAVKPDGAWLYRSGVRRGSKGTGKDPFFAAHALCELCGPVVVSDFDGTRVVGREHRLPLVQIAANSEAQASDVLRVANAMISRDMREDYGIDPGLTRTLLQDGGRLEILTASEKSAEGDPATFIGLNESHHMTESNGGHRTAEVARRNVAKSPGGLARVVEYTNAHELGADSVAEQSYLAWQAQVAGQTRSRDILYDSREAPPGIDLTDEADLMRGLRAAYSDAPWASLTRLRDDVWDPRTTPEQSTRFYLNSLAAKANSWIEPVSFDALARRDLAFMPGDEIVLFLDCSKSQDATGLVGCRVSDGHVQTMGMWQRPHGDRGKGWLAPREEVRSILHEARARYRVRALWADPSPATDDETEASYWLPLLDELHRDWREELLWATPGRTGHAVVWDMRTSSTGGAGRNDRFTKMAERLQVEIDEEGPSALQQGRVPPLTHDGDPRLRQHVHNARRRPNQWGVGIGKESRDSSRKIDLAVCMVGARLARRDVLLQLTQDGGDGLPDLVYGV